LTVSHLLHNYKDAAERVVSGVEVRLTHWSSTDGSYETRRRATTSTAGRYVFEGVPDSNLYRFIIGQLPGYLEYYPSENVTITNGLFRKDIGLKPAGSPSLITPTPTVPTAGLSASFTKPAEGYVMPSTAFNIEVKATSPASTISSIKVYLDSTSTTPFKTCTNTLACSFWWTRPTTLSAGNHQLIGVVTNSQGQSVTTMRMVRK